VRKALPFFVLTFAITWPCFFGAAELSLQPETLNSWTRAIRLSLLLVGTFAPAIASLSLTFYKSGSTGLSKLFGRILQPDIELRWYAFAVGFMAVIKIGVLFIHRAAFGTWPQISYAAIAAFLPALMISTPIQSGEELGWRGYALPRLVEDLGFARASVLLGLIWGIWHMPLFFVAGMDHFGQSFPLFALGTTALSVAMTFLYSRTEGSLLLMMLMHSAVNQTVGILPQRGPEGSPFTLSGSPVMLLTLGLLWIAAAYFLVRMQQRSSAGRSTP